jgi:alkylation response protein AidB-like acyl-CoA dehydrogenase
MSFSKADVAKHNTQEDLWVIIDGKVYDLTKFGRLHPGGLNIILTVAGQEATQQFDLYHKRTVLDKYAKLVIGECSDSPSKKKVVPKGHFGETVQYAEPSWYQGFNTGYYKESHIRFRSACREFVDRELMPYLNEIDETKKLPEGIHKKAAQFMPGVVGGKWPVEYVGDDIPGGVLAKEWDYFHELILYDEFSRTGSGGVVWGLLEGIGIGLPPIMLFGNKYLQDKTVKQCLTGEKVICLCITEPFGGSDVANLRTTAKLTPDGKHYVVNGEKKWITTGTFADFFSVACRTPDGQLSMLLLERGMAGIKTRAMNVMGVWGSGTSFITFENVKVPVENLIGKQGEGFKYVMQNFNHERWALIIQISRFCRVCIEDCFKYANKRKTFGKRLIENGVIRAKLGNMIRKVESLHAWLEQITYQMNTMSHQDSMKVLGGPIALLKYHSTQAFEFCTSQAIQIYGGLGYSRGSQADRVERLYRDVKAYSIGGGSEEILLDLGVKQAIKFSSL